MDNQRTCVLIRKRLPAVVVCACFILGFVLGCTFVAVIEGNSARQLSEYLTDYFSVARDDEIKSSFIGTAWAHGRWFVFCFVAMFSGFAFFVIPVLNVVRGFLFAFGIGCFVRFSGLSGLVLAGIVFGIPAVFWLPGLLLISICGLHMGFVFSYGSTPMNNKFTPSLCRSVVLSIGLFLVCVFLEYSLLPVLLPSAASILG